MKRNKALAFALMVFFIGIFILTVIGIKIKTKDRNADIKVIKPIQEYIYEYDGRTVKEVAFYGFDIETGESSFYYIVEDDKQGNPISLNSMGGPVQEYSNMYDEKGQLIEQCLDYGQGNYFYHTYEYDEDNNLIKEVEYYGDNKIVSTTDYQYEQQDSMRKVTKIFDGSTDKYTNVYVYNEKGQLVEDCYEENCITTYEYDDEGFIKTQHVEVVGFPEYNRDFYYYRDEHKKEIFDYDENGQSYMVEESFYDNSVDMGQWISPIEYTCRINEAGTIYRNDMTQCIGESYCIQNTKYDSFGNVIEMNNEGTWDTIYKENSVITIHYYNGQIGSIYILEYYD